MMRLVLVGLCATFVLAWGLVIAQAQPAPEPPSDASVLRALSRPPAGVVRDDIVFTKEQVRPGTWRCTAYYTESMRLPRAVVPLGKKVESVIIGPAGPMAAASLKPWPVCRQA
jgi:hypothetical protein